LAGISKGSLSNYALDLERPDKLGPTLVGSGDSVGTN
jgi:hypothetical protein